MARTLRRKLARHAAERLLKGDVTVIDELAALIVSERREREIDLLVQDIEAELAAHGTIVATVESATPLDDVVRQEVKGLLSSAARHRDAGFAPGFRSGNSGCRAPSDDRAAQHVERPDAEVPSDRSTKDITVLLRESIDQALIGGFKLRTPTATLDATIAKKLNDLRAKKI